MEYQLRVLAINSDISPRFNDSCFHYESNRDQSVKLKTPRNLYTHEQFYLLEKETVTALLQVDDEVKIAIHLN